LLADALWLTEENEDLSLRLIYGTKNQDRLTRPQVGNVALGTQAGTGRALTEGFLQGNMSLRSRVENEPDRRSKSKQERKIHRGQEERGH
jgi:hypothetical protein